MKTPLRPVPLVFFRVVVVIAIGACVVFLLISYLPVFHGWEESHNMTMARSQVCDCIIIVPRCRLVKDLF